MRILGIIPAREGSKRVPKKNFRPFAGTTLTDLAIQHAQASKYITDYVVSTDSEEVLQIAEKYGENIGLKRPVSFATDESPAIEYILHALEVLEGNDREKFDFVVILQPSSPLRTAEDIDNTIELLINNPNADSSVSVVKVDHMIHPVKLKNMTPDKLLLPYFEEEKGRFAANELPDIYVRNCAVYVGRREGLEERGNIIGEKSIGYLMPADRSVDINEMLDFEFAEYLFIKHS